MLPASDQSRCIVDVQQLALSLGLVIAVCAALTVVTIGAFRRICIRDVSLEHGKTRLRTVVHQFLCDAGRTSWPFHLRGCAHPCHEGRRVNGTTLELIDAQGQAISERKDISIGILTLPSFRVFSTRPSECPSLRGLCSPSRPRPASWHGARFLPRSPQSRLLPQPHRQS